MRSKTVEGFDVCVAASLMMQHKVASEIDGLNFIQVGEKFSEVTFGLRDNEYVNLLMDGDRKIFVFRRRDRLSDANWTIFKQVRNELLTNYFFVELTKEEVDAYLIASWLVRHFPFKRRSILRRLVAHPE